MISSCMLLCNSLNPQWREMSHRDHSPQQGAGPNLVDLEVMRKRSELFRAECTRLMLETDKTCKRMQNDDHKQLGK